MNRGPVGVFVCLFGLEVAASADRIQIDVHPRAIPVTMDGYVNAPSTAPADKFDTLLFSGPVHQMALPGPARAGAESDVSGLASGSDISWGFSSGSLVQATASAEDFNATGEQSGIHDQLVWSGDPSDGINALFAPGTAMDSPSPDPEPESRNSLTAPAEGENSSGLSAMNSSPLLEPPVSTGTTIPTRTLAFLVTTEIEAIARSGENSDLSPYEPGSPSNFSSSSSELHVPEPSTLLMLIFGLLAVPLEARADAREGDLVNLRDPIRRSE